MDLFSCNFFLGSWAGRSAHHTLFRRIDIMVFRTKEIRMTKWLALALMAIVSVTMAAPDQTLTKAERDKAVAELEGSRQMFLDATKGLSAAQWNFKAGPDRWSIAECAEHIA